MEELKGKVMLVDDDETIILPIKMMLKRRNMDCISFTNPEEALDYLKSNKVDVILVDYHMEPSINGDEFIKRLREFDNESIAYLHTAYSEELPATEMMEKYNIQGYIDKGKGDEERIQQLTSALKHNELLKLIKKQAQQIDSLNYNYEFMGKFLGMLMGEIKEKSFGMVLNIDELKEIEHNFKDANEDTFNRCVENISDSVHKINELIDALDIEERTITVNELATILQKLFQVKLCVSDTKLTIRAEGENSLIECDIKILLYMLVDIIEYLISKGEKQINIYSEKLENVGIFKVCNDIENDELIQNNELIEKLKKLAMFDERIFVEKEFGQIVIKIKNLKKFA